MPGTRSLLVGVGVLQRGLDVRDGLHRLSLVGAVLGALACLGEHLLQVASSHRVLRVLARPQQVPRLGGPTPRQPELQRVLGLLLRAKHRLDVLGLVGLGDLGRTGRQRGQVGLRRRVVGVVGRPLLQACLLVLTSPPRRRVGVRVPLGLTDLARGRILRRHVLPGPDVGRAQHEQTEADGPYGRRHCESSFHCKPLSCDVRSQRLFSVRPSDTHNTQCSAQAHKRPSLSRLCT